MSETRNPIFHDHVLSIVGLTVRVIGHPKSPALLLLHGAWQSGDMFLPLPTSCIGRYYALIPDLRGHGASRKPREVQDYRLDQFAEDLRMVLEECRVGHVTAYLASPLATRILGAYFAKSGPEPFSEVILASAARSAVGQEITGLSSSDRETHYRAVLAWLTRQISPTDPQFWRQVAQALLVPPAACKALVAALQADMPASGLGSWQSWPVKPSIFNDSPPGVWQDLVHPRFAILPAYATSRVSEKEASSCSTQRP